MAIDWNLAGFWRTGCQRIAKVYGFLSPANSHMAWHSSTTHISCKSKSDHTAKSITHSNKHEMIHTKKLLLRTTLHHCNRHQTKYPSSWYKTESPMDAHFSWHSTNLNLVLPHSRIQSQIVYSHTENELSVTVTWNYAEALRHCPWRVIQSTNPQMHTHIHTHTHIYTHTHLHTQMHKVHTRQTHISIFPFICIIKIRTKWRNVCKCYGGVKPRNVTRIYIHTCINIYTHACTHTQHTHTYSQKLSPTHQYCAWLHTHILTHTILSPFFQSYNLFRLCTNQNDWKWRNQTPFRSTSVGMT